MIASVVKASAGSIIQQEKIRLLLFILGKAVIMKDIEQERERKIQL